MYVPNYLMIINWKDVYCCGAN